MKIAVVGCAHGNLERIFNDVKCREEAEQVKLDLLIICGDFQAVRNEHDLQCVAIPPKYYDLGTFYKYYNGELKAPILTIFVGGNHEASNYLQTLAYGGWAAPNIYYLGYANVVRFGGLRIGGISGIFKRHDANSGHYERLPYSESSKRSAYHMRSLHIYRLLQLCVSRDPEITNKTTKETSLDETEGQKRTEANSGFRDANKESTDQPKQIADIFISHDWPLNIHSCGNVNWLLKVKRHFLPDIQNNALGNPLLEPLVNSLKPRYWFAAHLHVRFEAFVHHTPDGRVQTKFLALDKCQGNRRYMEIIDIEPTKPISNEELVLEYDPEWLAVLKNTNDYMSTEPKPNKRHPQLYMREHFSTSEQVNEVSELFNGDFTIPHNFEMSEPTLNGRIDDSDPERKRNFANPQTTLFCEKLKITDPIALILDQMKQQANPDEISISDEEEESEYKKPKLEDNVDGGNLFFIDKKGV